MTQVGPINKSGEIAMKKNLIIMVWALVLLLGPVSVLAQLKGRVLDSESKLPLPSASVHLTASGHKAKCDEGGWFLFSEYSMNDTLNVSYLGYVERNIPVGTQTANIFLVYLDAADGILPEVTINTGFYQVPRDRATGSFTHVDNEQLNRAVGGNILQRLDGVASGLQFVNADGNSAADIRVRGIATIRSDDTPLVVVDNFPYDGDIRTINPNDIESVTILKDGAASSIWGARAGNGVIVITTKGGSLRRATSVSFNSNVTIGKKPDLYYSRSWLPSELVMEIEKEKYQRGGYYLETEQQTPFPEYVELLIARERGSISETFFREKEATLRRIDVRQQAMEHLYRPSAYYQNAVNVRGGGEAFTYYLSTGFDRGITEVIGNSNDRLNISLQNTFMPSPRVELMAGVWYSELFGRMNGLSLGEIHSGHPSIGLSPYTRLKDDDLENLPIVKDYRLAYIDQIEKNGLVDWHYRPLDERLMANNRSRNTELRFNGGTKLHIGSWVSLHANYQHTRSQGSINSLYEADSYYVRDMVNRFTQPGGSRIIPHAAIFNAGNTQHSRSHSGRVQVNFNKTFHIDHHVSAIGGGEIRELVRDVLPGYTLYNYDKELLTGSTLFNYLENYQTLPKGRSRIPVPSNARAKYVDRFLSYYGNGSYTYLERYILSASVRWDGSNLFGVKTNQKGTPLWSVGGSWEISKEDFFYADWINYLRLRGTYGKSGNVNNNLSAYPVIVHAGINSISGFSSAQIRSAGNPSLRWEKVKTWNVGMDVTVLSRRISAMVDIYVKDGTDLIGADYLPPNTGIVVGGTASTTNLVNYADLRTKGMDLEISSRNITGPFTWNSVFLFNYVHNQITNFHTAEVSGITPYLAFNPPPVRGQSRDVVYAFPWFGLDGKNGQPILYVNGEQSTDYAGYFHSYKPEDLVVTGVRVPPYHGSIRNNIAWKNLSLSVMLTWKSGYVFRRRTSVPEAIYEGPWAYHSDYYNRWSRPGDERFTIVPAYDEEYIWQRGTIYENSEALVTRGDHVRLKDIAIDYTLTRRDFAKLPFSRIRFYAYSRNLGIIWRANKQGIDPDFPTADYVMPRTFAIGVQVDF